MMEGQPVGTPNSKQLLHSTARWVYPPPPAQAISQHQLPGFHELQDRAYSQTAREVQANWDSLEFAVTILVFYGGLK